MSATENVFGANCKIHPITNMPLESGIGSLPEHQQALLHLAVIEAEQGEAVADGMRRKLGIKTRAEREAAEKAKAEEDEKQKERVKKALALLEEVERDEASKAEAARLEAEKSKKGIA